MAREVDMDVNKCVVNNTLKILVKPKARKTEIVSIDDGVVNISVKAQPIDNEANIEVIKYFSKLLKRKVRIKSGLTSKHKILFVD